MSAINKSVLPWTICLAQEAGALLLQYDGSTLKRSIKTSVNDFVTEADLAAENVILAAIAKTFPQDDILSEESGFSGTHSAEYTWVIDPLDGTWNFAHGSDNYGVMISRAHGAEIELAVVFNPAKQLLAAAQIGFGVQLNNSPVALSFPTELSKTNPIVGYQPDFPGAQQLESLQKHFVSLGLHPKSLRSAAANMLSLLTGERDIYVGNAFYPWDFAPMNALLVEAGYRVTNGDGGPLQWSRGQQHCVVAPPELHATILALFQSGAF